jgi:hypothetical protein
METNKPLPSDIDQRVNEFENIMRDENFRF